MVGSRPDSCSGQGHMMACYKHTNKPWNVTKRRKFRTPEELSVSHERFGSMG